MGREGEERGREGRGGQRRGGEDGMRRGSGGGKGAGVLLFEV